MVKTFWQVFNKKPVILGMIHLAGEHPIDRAIEELKIYQEEGFSGAIIEDNHSPTDYVLQTLEVIEDQNFDLKIGVSILGSKSSLTNEYETALKIAGIYNLDFAKLDFVTGKYKEGEVPKKHYLNLKESCPNTLVLSGVHPKYFTSWSNLERDIAKTSELADAIIVSESEIGVETPMNKIITFKNNAKDHPLIIGGGLTPENAYSQLCIADGAIVGTSLKKDRNTRSRVDREKTKAIMNAISSLTKNYS